jgi:sugar phosphate isomerase/epimerase
MRKYGLKLWSTNERYVGEAVRLHKEGLVDFIELFTVPGSYEKYAGVWAGLSIPYVIHGPHTMAGLNLARREGWDEARPLAREALRYADALRAGIVIFHPGIDGSVEDAVLHLGEIGDSRIVIENKPYHTIDKGGRICTGNSPEEIRYLMDKTGLGFCLDIGHAIFSANARRADPFSDLHEYLAMGPKIFHLTDGDGSGVFDSHLHIGSGSFPMERILRLLPGDGLITVETDKSFPDSLSDFAEDVRTLHALDDTRVEGGRQ